MDLSLLHDTALYFILAGAFLYGACHNDDLKASITGTVGMFVGGIIFVVGMVQLIHDW
jgi:hypothetical protein